MNNFEKIVHSFNFNRLYGRIWNFNSRFTEQALEEYLDLQNISYSMRLSD